MAFKYEMILYFILQHEKFLQFDWLRAVVFPVFSLNFSSAGKGPFMDGKAKNIYFSKGRGGGGTVE